MNLTYDQHSSLTSEQYYHMTRIHSRYITHTEEKKGAIEEQSALNLLISGNLSYERRVTQH